MSDTDMVDAAAATGAAMEQAVGVFMLHPETFGESVAAGYQNPFTGYVAGRGGVLGEATGTTVGSVFAVFEPSSLSAMWEEGVAVRGAAAAAQLYWDQTAEFGRKYLSGARRLERITTLGEKVIAATPAAGLPLFADGADKKDRYAEVERATNRRMAEVFAAALDPSEADELARLSTDALASLQASVPG